MNRNYTILIFILAFYVFAQTFQQFVLRSGPLAGVSNFEETILAGQHPLNYVRHVLILLSMFLMVPGFILLGLHFYKDNSLLSILSIVFFLFFCLFEIGYRSINLFQVMTIWGKELAEATASQRAILLPKFQQFYQTVNVIYFPLLFSLLCGSVFLFCASLKNSNGKPVSIAMALHSVQQLSRLSGYTPFTFLDIFTGIWYFVIVFIVFSLLIYWAIKMTIQS